jgi:hypothetical protein
MYKAFASWARWFEFCKVESRKFAESYKFQWRHYFLRSFMARWVDIIKVKGIARRPLLVARRVRRIKSASLSRAWLAWCERRRGKARRRHIMEAVGIKLFFRAAAVVFYVWLDKTELGRWRLQLESMGREYRMMNAGGNVKGSIFVGDESLGKVVISDHIHGHSLSITMDVMNVPWCAFKTMGKLRYRLESSSQPSSPFARTPREISPILMSVGPAFTSIKIEDSKKYEFI